MTDLPKLLTTEEVKNMLRLKEVRTVYAYIDEGRIIAYRVGREYRIDEESVLKLLEAMRI